ncbi:MAG: hypothetical protein WA060_03440 [Minisyncoccia bacterium]
MKGMEEQPKPKQMDLDFVSNEKVDARELKDVSEEERDVLRQEIMKRRREGKSLTPLMSELELLDREESRHGSWETGF